MKKHNSTFIDAINIGCSIAIRMCKITSFFLKVFQHDAYCTIHLHFFDVIIYLDTNNHQTTILFICRIHISEHFIGETYSAYYFDFILYLVTPLCCLFSIFIVTSIYRWKKKKVER